MRNRQCCSRVAPSGTKLARTNAPDARIVIGQVAAGDRESKIIAARTLLRPLDLKGALVTGDALHSKGDTARIITQRGGNWLFTLKANRPTQHEEVATWFADP